MPRGRELSLSIKNVFIRKNLKEYSNDLLAGIIRDIPEQFIKNLSSEKEFRMFFSENFIYTEKQFKFILKYMEYKMLTPHFKKGEGL